MNTAQLLSSAKAALQDAFQSRLRGVVLYGSEARGQSAADSDVDLIVLLEGPVDDARDSWACIDALYDLVLESGRPIHAEPIDSEVYQEAAFPLFQRAAREGILL